MSDIIIKLLVALVFGAIIGFEREYSSKAAGFRTITMITLGATLFTILSHHLAGDTNPHYIMGNIVSGIGFLGAGVIFKETFSVSGLTTAATIWVSAGMGMAIGMGEYLAAGTVLAISILVLALFERVQGMIERIHQVRNYRINFHREYHVGRQTVEEELEKKELRYRLKKIIQTEEAVSFFYTISGKPKKMDNFSEFLVNTREVRSFEE